MTSMPPGWYDDGHGALRWWDGTQWTEHVATPDPEPVTGHDPDADQPTAVLPPELAEPQPVAASPQYAGEAPAGAYPGGYPGGFPGGAAPAGAFVAATEPAKSKLWIVWVVLGVVLLGIVIAAAVLIPLLFLTLGSGGGSNGGATDDEAAAVAAVELYDEAWREVDCDKYVASTTEDFREGIGLPDCADFEPSAQEFSDSVENYVLTVTDIQNDGSSITIETSETYGSFIDDEGNVVDESIPVEDRWTYILVPAGDGWAIDEAD